MNGWLAKVLTGALATLLVAAVIGTYTVAGRLASLDATVAAMSEAIESIDERVRYVERHGPRP